MFPGVIERKRWPKMGLLHLIQNLQHLFRVDGLLSECFRLYKRN